MNTQLQSKLIDLNEDTITTEGTVDKRFLRDLVTLDKVYPDPDPILTYEDKPIAIKGELSSIVGKAKSRKSFFNTLLMKQLVTPGKNWTSELKGQILYVDTEQKHSRVQYMMKRLEFMKADPSKHLFLPVRAYDTANKMIAVEQFLHGYEDIEYVIIDNLRDFLPSGDINNQTDATEVVNKFVQLANMYNVHISLVLHTNPVPPAPGEAPKPSGAIGSKLLQACSSIIYVEKTDLTTSVIHPMEMRDGDFDSFSMKIEMEGDLAIPVYVGQDETTKKLASDKDWLVKARDHYLDKHQMAETLEEILSRDKEFNTTELKDAIYSELARDFGNAAPMSKDKIRKDITKVFHLAHGIIKRDTQNSKWEYNPTWNAVNEVELPF